MPGPWLGIVLVLAALLGLQLGVRLWRCGHPERAELARKLMHVSLGLLTLTFPRLFDQAWPVFVVCGAIALWLILVRRLALVKSHFGGAIEVERVSWGEVYFPIGVAVMVMARVSGWFVWAPPVVSTAVVSTPAVAVSVLIVAVAPL